MINIISKKTTYCEQGSKYTQVMVVTVMSASDLTWIRHASDFTALGSDNNSHIVKESSMCRIQRWADRQRADMRVMVGVTNRRCTSYYCICGIFSFLFFVCGQWLQ